MMYTVVPPEVLWEDLWASEWEEDLDEPGYESEVHQSSGGIALSVRPIGNGKARVESLLSTDPNHFLLEHTRPGTIVTLRQR